jgi:hypothetical protein
MRTAQIVPVYGGRLYPCKAKYIGLKCPSLYAFINDATPFMKLKGDRLNLPQFDGHFEKAYTTKLKGVSNEKEAVIFEGVQARSSPIIEEEGEGGRGGGVRS